ncbi:NPD-domain-containing protein [Basidiobolus meristosporus CBS 931.73]|uniref:NPD-domain-containing protein n=1 Tax=Basidiobolus meristosporus CBS 931.73 TaxID=1314790 RepID=A0A1Y1ZBR8_9FUNG|nr:NPD-domain-containing protein [Basidiobolus meristosporus CBS 931.73]|eukprot:ORY07699.1 NPD-domain-containing protein [Basidiobolus meristosporus CBS 931.73]
MSVIKTPLTELFGIQHPIMLAGMNVAAGPELVAAVTNAGGIGVLGGHGYTPKVLRSQIHELKSHLKDPNGKFGVDLLLPQVGGSARKTNYDYQKGQLNELIDIIIDEKSSLFVCAVGVPPKHVVKRLHKAGIPVMNMVGHPKHVPKALEQGVDLICAQAGEGGGHTGDIPQSILIPACVDAVKGHKSPLTGAPVYVVAAGAIYDGRGLAANLMYGAIGVWVGTRFVASVEAGAPKKHKEELLSASYEDAVTTLIYTGRPLRVRRTEYVDNWNNNRQTEIKELTSKGILPYEHDLQQHPEIFMETRPWLIGRVAALINEVLPAKVIVDNMVNDAAKLLQNGSELVQVKAKL